MDTTPQVPLWLYLLTALLSPLIAAGATLVATKMANADNSQRLAEQREHTLEVMERQREDARQAWLKDRKHGLYDDALRSLGKSRAGLLDASNKQNLMGDVQSALARLHAYASPTVRTAAVAAEASVLDYYLAGSKDDAQALMRSYKSFGEKLDALSAAMRKEMTEM